MRAAPPPPPSAATPTSRSTTSCREAAVTGITLEYGTVPVKAMLDAIRADNWLHIHGSLDCPEGRAIKARIRQAFYPDKNDWRRMVWERVVDVTRRMTKGLAES